MIKAQAPRILYNPFPKTNYLEQGDYGHILRFPDTVIVLKIPHRIINGAPHEEARAAESLKALKRDRAIYETLATKPTHPNTVQYFLSTDLAIFIKFEPDTLEKRLDRPFTVPISEGRQHRWIMEIARAASWLESLDYVHGDIRPAKILLDGFEHVNICDFRRTTTRGCEIEVATFPTYRPGTHAIAGPAHEQFAIGSCIMHRALLRGDYPSTVEDSTLGPVTLSCWNAHYGSMKDVEHAIEITIGVMERQDDVAAHISTTEYNACIQKCRDFLFQHEQGDILME
ncbi:hypothetical protein F66182_9428 [Fusarium sp. NRRL 66182]|nr:hypothetical protein F66182_9428 [Fusarium sp. NRRL 66182]